MRTSEVRGQQVVKLKPLEMSLELLQRTDMGSRGREGGEEGGSE